MNARNHISDYKLERYLLGELPSNELDSIRRRAEDDLGVRKRLEALEQSNRELSEKYHSAWMSRRIQLKMEGPVVDEKRRFAAIQSWAVPVAVAAMLMVVVLPTLFGPDEETRVKGLEPQLKLFRKTGTGSERLEDGSLAGEGDLVQIVYIAAGERYGVVISSDGWGTMTLHLPLEGKHAVELQQEGPDNLDFSYELDDAPRWERFYFITADIPFDIAVARMAIRRAEDAGIEELALPRGFKQDLFILEKGASHE